MKFEKLCKDYQKTIIQYLYEHDYEDRQKTLKDQNFFAYMATYNYPIKKYNEAIKTNDFEELHELIDDVIWQYEKNTLSATFRKIYIKIKEIKRK